MTDFYPIYCILPNDRYLYMSNSELIPFGEIDESLEEIIYKSLQKKIILYEKNSSSPVIISFEELGRRLHFEYTAYLTFLHEKELRLSRFNFPDRDELKEACYFPTLLSNTLSENIILSVKHIGVINEIDVGYGLFVESGYITGGDLIGEYCGIVSSNASLTGDKLSYCCQYPSCDGGLMINAGETGNVVRFINHSSDPNAEFRSCLLQGIMHVLCFAQKDILLGEQITINYGVSYWMTKTSGSSECI